MLFNLTEQKKGILALIALSFFFASMGLFVRYLNTSFSTYQQVYLRLGVAFLISLLVFKNKISWFKLTKISVKDWTIILFRAVSYSLLGIVLFTQAIIITRYSNVSFIGAFPMVAIFGIILLGETLTLRKALWILVAFFGVLLISVENYEYLFSWGRGEVLTLISTVFFSLSYIARKWQSDFLNNQDLTVLNFFFATLAVFLVSFLKGDSLPVNSWSWGLFSAILGAGLINVFNMYLTNYGFEKVEAILAGNLLTLEAFFALIIGFLFYSETPLIKDFGGGILIITAVIAMNKFNYIKTS